MWLCSLVAPNDARSDATEAQYVRIVQPRSSRSFLYTIMSVLITVRGDEIADDY